MFRRMWGLCHAMARTMLCDVCNFSCKENALGTFIATCSSSRWRTEKSPADAKAAPGLIPVAPLQD